MTESVSALLPGLGPDAAREALERQAAAYELTCRDTAAGLELELWGGVLRLAGARLLLQAPDMRTLFILQEAASYAFDAAGCVPVWDSVDEGAPAPNLSLFRVAGCRRISRDFRRLRVEGPDLARFALGGMHVRLVFALAGDPGWPRIDARGRTHWPEGLHRPVYTIRRMDAAAGWADLDIFVHEGGRTTDWSATVAPGTEVGMIGPGGGEPLSGGWLGLFGDETALPAIARMLEGADRATTGIACLRAAPEDVAAIKAPPGVLLRVVPDLVAALRETGLPDGATVWFAAEKAEADAARADLRTRGIARDRMQVAAYWTRDKG
ncbi:siderophore-interacting protein [Halodurantibacterium flavum]|uniref:Siderophore-interacting protein n=1 Tax=Halodurantibacterium flavum TaxID=1382802 RepID=A0ABW4S5M9_9RHOB